MFQVEEQLTQRLAPLGMNPEEGASGLIFTSALESEDSIISLHERLLLERAQRVGVDAVYFKQYSEPNRTPVAQVYIFDFVNRPPRDLAEIHKNVWSSTDVRIYFVVTKTEIKIFNSAKPVDIDSYGKYHIQPYDVLKLVGEAKEKYSIYSASKFDNGTFWSENTDDFGYNNTAYERLISELKGARKTFLNEIHLKKEIANKLLVLSILVKYLEERIDTDANGIESRVFSRNFFNKQIFGRSQNLVDVIRNGRDHKNEYVLNLFKFLGSHFYGEIFTIPDAYIEDIRLVNLSPLADFLSGEFQHHTKQYVMWRLYSFNYLPIELISSIYEEFLEADKTNGVAYTPAYLVNLLVDECMPLNVPKHDFRVLDPACGSGIFLVAVFKRLVDWWRVEIFNETNVWVKPSSEELPALKELMVNNVFGVDIAPEAVNLAIFSLSLTLCDMLSPTVIWEDLKFNNLSQNVATENFFDWAENNSHNRFDLIIGNPPFIEYKQRVVKIITLLSKHSLAVPVPSNQSALLFTVFASKLIKESTGSLCFILPAGPLLYNNSPIAAKFRKHLFETYSVPQIIDFTYLSRSLFKNKGNEKEVAVAALFIQGEFSVHSITYHVVAKKLKTISQRHYFEFDHYDFHPVRRHEAINSSLVWKANLLGGGRLRQLLERLSSMPTLKDYLLERKKYSGWFFGDGFRKGKDDIFIEEADLGQKAGQYKEADFLTGSKTFENIDFDEQGIRNTKFIQDIYFQYPRTREMFTAPLLLIKKSIGQTSIPVYLSKENISYKNEIIGIHCPEEDIEELRGIHDVIKNNPLFRFYSFAISGRSGINRSARTALQSDILSVPYINENSAVKLSYEENIIVDDTLEYWLDFLAKEINIKMLAPVLVEELYEYALPFCNTLNLLFNNPESGYKLKSIQLANSFAYLKFSYMPHKTLDFHAEVIKVDESSINSLLSERVGANHRLIRIVKYYEGEDIIILKPLEKRYWLKSIALRDADEVVKDLYDAGY